MMTQLVSGCYAKYLTIYNLLVHILSLRYCTTKARQPRAELPLCNILAT